MLINAPGRPVNSPPKSQTLQLDFFVGLVKKQDLQGALYTYGVRCVRPDSPSITLLLYYFMDVITHTNLLSELLHVLEKTAVNF